MTTSSKIDVDVTTAIGWLLEHNLDVTARAVAARVGVVPTTITRNEKQRNWVITAFDEQVRLRAIVADDKSSREALLAKVERRDKTIAELERKIAILTASHRAMLMAAGEIGGEPLGRNSSPSTRKYVRNCSPYTRYRIRIYKKR
jgi:hypothetical protein